MIDDVLNFRFFNPFFVYRRSQFCYFSPFNCRFSSYRLWKYAIVLSVQGGERNFCYHISGEIYRWVICIRNKITFRFDSISLSTQSHLVSLFSRLLIFVDENARASFRIHLHRLHLNKQFWKLFSIEDREMETFSLLLFSPLLSVYIKETEITLDFSYKLDHFGLFSTTRHTIHSNEEMNRKLIIITKQHGNCCKKKKKTENLSRHENLKRSQILIRMEMWELLLLACE